MLSIAKARKQHGNGWLMISWMFMFLFFSHLFVCRLWLLFAFNFDDAYLLLVDGHRKELMDKGGIA
jgi:hypothetical protein